MPRPSRCLWIYSALAAGLLAVSLGACGEDDEATSSPAEVATEATETTTSDPTTDADTDTSGTEAGAEQAPTDPVTGIEGVFCPAAETPPNIVNVVSYGTDCGAVEDAMAQLEGIRKSFRIGDFNCARVEGGQFSGTWECRGEANFFTFDFAD